MDFMDDFFSFLYKALKDEVRTHILKNTDFH